MRIIIIGAGPVGCYTGFILAKKGHMVKIFEKGHVGSPIRCTGIVTRSINDIITLPSHVIINRLKKVSIYSQKNKVTIPSDDIVIDRYAFDNYMANIAKEAGAEIITGKAVTKIHSGHVIIDDKPVVFDKLIGADGPRSLVSRYLGNNLRYFIGNQVRVKYSFDKEGYMVFLGSNFPKFFGWVVPESSSIARIGLASRTNPRLHLNKLLGWFPGKVIDHQGGLIPIYSTRTLYHKDNIYVVGDAAGMVKETTGGGLVQGLLGAKVLAESIVKKTGYEKDLKIIKSELNISKSIRKMLNHFTDKELDELISMVDNKKVKKVLKENSRDYPLRLILNLIISRPGLIRFATKARYLL